MATRSAAGCESWRPSQQAQQAQQQSKPGSINASGKHQCPRCPSSFKRPEHLKRHQRGHEELKRFSCPTCFKRFARSDILTRHTAIHNNPARCEPLSSNGEVKRRRACLECARAREKCTKSSPCMRCSIRSLICVYPDAQSTAALKPRDAQHAQHAHQVAPTGGSPLQAFQPPSLNVITATATNNGYSTFDGQVISPISVTQNEGSHCSVVDDSHNRASRFGPSMTTTQPFPAPISNAFGTVRSGPVGYQQHSHVPATGAASQGTPGFAYPSSMYDPALNFPINWLPANHAVDIDYSSILGLPLHGSALPTAPSLIACETSEAQGLLDDSAQSHAIQARQQSPSVSPTATVSTAPQCSARLPDATRGGLYSNSNTGARVPYTVRSRKAPYAQIHQAQPVVPITEGGIASEYDERFLGFPSLHHLTLESPPEFQLSRTLRTPTYEAICGNFRRTCLNSSGLHSHYISPDFPSIEHFNLFIHLYFDHFDAILPIIHDQLSNINDYYPLALAVATIGCHYTQTREFSSCVTPMHEFLRRVLQMEMEMRRDTRLHLPLLQALILNQIGSLYFGSPKLEKMAKRRHGELVNLVQSYELLRDVSVSRQPAKPEGGSSRFDRSQEKETPREKWTSWVLEETKRRLGYTVWLLDCMMAYHFGMECLLSQDAARAPLPHDGLWAAGTAQEWLDILSRTRRNPSLSMATQFLFREKEVKYDVGEFARILLLHGIYREIFLVKSYHTRPLSCWTPSAQSRHTFGREVPDPGNLGLKEKWPSDVSAFANWRNAALDCVDVLHWSANGTIAMLAGAEHPTVLHLHLARVVLLVPYDDIITLAMSVMPAGEGRGEQGRVPSRQEALHAEREVLRWAQQDEFKARLAALHCGCLFWHVRRYSAMAFYEPVSVYLATMTLWAYSYYTSQADAQMGAPKMTGHRAGSRSGSASPDRADQFSDANIQESPLVASSAGTTAAAIPSHDSDPTFIRLDRPNDDEMVQLFVRSGRPSAMRAYMTGVGDVCAPTGPARILREGCRILGTVSLAWGRTAEYLQVLEAVEQATIDRRGDEDGGRVANHGLG